MRLPTELEEVCAPLVEAATKLAKVNDGGWPVVVLVLVLGVGLLAVLAYWVSKQ